jgi:hypothetical protein
VELVSQRKSSLTKSDPIYPGWSIALSACITIWAEAGTATTIANTAATAIFIIMIPPVTAEMICVDPLGFAVLDSLHPVFIVQAIP